MSEKPSISIPDLSRNMYSTVSSHPLIEMFLHFYPNSGDSILHFSRCIPSYSLKHLTPQILAPPMCPSEQYHRGA